MTWHDSVYQLMELSLPHNLARSLLCVLYCITYELHAHIPMYLYTTLHLTGLQYRTEVLCAPEEPKLT